MVQYKGRASASKEIDEARDVSIPIPPKKQTETADAEPVEEIIPDRLHTKVIEWRSYWLQKAGWTEDRALYIAYLTMTDLIDIGYSESEAARAYPDFWRLACKVRACGNETQALYILGLTSER